MEAAVLGREGVVTPFLAADLNVGDLLDEGGVHHVLGQCGVDVQAHDVTGDLNHSVDIGRVETIQRCNLDSDLANIVVLGHRCECDLQRGVNLFVVAFAPACEVFPYFFRRGRWDGWQQGGHGYLFVDFSDDSLSNDYSMSPASPLAAGVRYAAVGRIAAFRFVSSAAVPLRVALPIGRSAL